ncbi:16717_t:CDS:2, partial [Entrophospora sp. SA101]
MGNKPHSLTPHIYILNEKANNFNKYVLCLYCRNALGHEVAYQNKLLNKKDRIKSHLKKCENFKVVVGEQNINQILEEEIHPNSQKRARTIEPKSILEDHLLCITVSNGLAFRWIESEEVKSLFRWLNPNIRLPNRKALSGRILNDASLKHNSWIKEQASNSEYGVTVALDGWSNVVNEKILGVILITNEGETLVWNAYDISGERSRTQEVLQHITLIFEDLQSKNIMINATLVTKYQATRNLRTNERSFVLSDDLCQIISNEEWWEDVEELKDLMKPFAR